MNRQIHFLSALLLTLTGISNVHAEDIEIYTAAAAGAAGGVRPKVLIILDDSGSMSSTVADSKPAYDPSTTYSTQGSIQSGRVYWSTDGDPPPSNTDQYFSTSINRCASSSTALGTSGVGYYQDLLRSWSERTTYTRQCVRWSRRGSCRRYDWVPDGTETDWFNLNTDDVSTAHVECNADVTNADDSNPGTTDGYPQTAASGGPYNCATTDCSNVGFDRGYTLYSANYMNYFYNPATQDRDRLEIAQEVITTIVDANQSVDFGLMVFNKNDDSSSDGGRVIKRIIPNMTDADRTALNAQVNATVHDGYTPLCETAYEAYRYLTGGAVLYGLEKDSGDTPARDTDAESGSNYVTPINSNDVCQSVYIILMTDGQPTNDTDANSRIKTLTGKSSCIHSDNCLPELAEYMHTHDLDGDDTNGTQRGTFYTIGFHTDQQLLEDTAELGGGKYYKATNTFTLANAFQSALIDILSGTSTFTSPAVAVNTFNRTRSRDEIFLAMFEPKEGDRWPGNLKKLKAGTNVSGDLVWKDKNGEEALNDATGNIKDEATTYWSTSVDGSAVEEGGAGQVLVNNGYANRTIKSNTGTDDALETFESANITRDVFGLDTDAELFTLFGVADQTALTSLINWARGMDVLDEDKDGSTSDTRPWILGDSLHSRPLAVNYGCTPVATCTPEIRILVGTNDGFLHMFDNDDGSEAWAFFPKELAPILKQRMDNEYNTSGHAYAIDGSPVSYVYDANRDGYIDPSTDKVWVFFGLRRGGDEIFALDITNMDSPSFMWMVSSDYSGFEELGQSWSTPQVATAPGHVDGSGKPKPVLIFGGGYDINKDSTASVATADSEGRGIYVVDAETGTRIWSVAASGTASATHVVDATLAHSIAAPVAKLDSNGDGFHDRIYAADTGGNIWRVDMPSTSTSSWKLRKLADFSDGDNDPADDRRFFNKPDVVRTYKSNRGYDGVLIGSGDRTNPLGTDVTNRLYAIHDMATYPYYTADPTSAECAAASTDFRCQLPLDETKLYNATSNLVQDGSTAAQAAAATDIYNKYGWYVTLENSGEKSLSDSITIQGITFFTSYTPNAGNTNSCVPGAGLARLYALDTQNASAVLDFSGNGTLSKEDRVVELGSLILDRPSVYVDEHGRIRLFFPAGGTGGVDNDNIDSSSSSVDPEASIVPAHGTYWYMEEN